MPLRRLHDALVALSRVERRLEPFLREPVDAVVREPMAAAIQFLINVQRKDEGLALAEERKLPGEDEATQAIIDRMHDQMAGRFKPGGFERGGNTKTHGIVRAEVQVLDGLPDNLRKGVFKEPRTFKAWVRYSGPGPDVPKDIDDVGFVSMTVKLMGVEGPKLMEEEKFTQDLLCVCTPTFVTPNSAANAVLQKWSLERTPLWYFLDPRQSHVLDFLMQGLWNQTQYNPLGQSYYSCVPYLLGEGQAMKYAFVPRTKVVKTIPGVPFGAVPDNYLHDNMVRTLDAQDVEFDICVQVQTDPHRMPIENAAVRWPTRLSPQVPVARLRIPRQTFNSEAQQVGFAKVLKYNPWHCIAEHRPLGNQSRTRRRLYYELSKYRQAENGVTHYEPNGDEVFA
ncbi:MAG: catalase family protein [Caulobacteraceae bacterium]